jgi:hypothetical protein
MAYANNEQVGRVQPLRCWTSRQVEAVRAAAQQVICDWCTAWGMDPSSAQVLITNGDACEQPSLDALHRALHIALFGESAIDPASGLDAPVASRVRERVLGDLRERMIAWARVDLIDQTVSAQPTHIPKPWSGDLVLRWRWAGLEGHWVLAFQAVSKLVPAFAAPRPTLTASVDLAQALADHHFTVRAGLSPISLLLGDLASLGIGDIVKLNHRLDQPLQLSMADSHAGLCAGWLGQRQGRKALELTAADTPST